MSDPVTRETVASADSGERGLDEAAHAVYLRPGDYELSRGPTGSLRLTLGSERSVLRVRARRCFPLSALDRFISLRDGTDQEIGIVPDLAELSVQDREWIEEELSLRYHSPRVVRIRGVRHRWGGVEWQLETDSGPRRVITKRVHDAISEIGGGRFILSDVDGNRYDLCLSELDDASRAVLDRMM